MTSVVVVNLVTMTSGDWSGPGEMEVTERSVGKSIHMVHISGEWNSDGMAKPNEGSIVWLAVRIGRTDPNGVIGKGRSGESLESFSTTKTTVAFLVPRILVASFVGGSTLILSFGGAVHTSGDREITTTCGVKLVTMILTSLRCLGTMDTN